MKNFFFSVFLIIVVIPKAFTQPSSDGGINIMYITAGENQNTQTLKQEDFRVNFYYKKASHNKRKLKNAYISFTPMKRHYYTFKNPDGIIYVPDHIPVIRKGELNLPSQRLEIIYKNDTMIVDFEDVPLYGTGHTAVMDTLQFYPGKHFKIYMEPLKVRPKRLEQYQYYTPNPMKLWGSELLRKVRKIIQDGITDRTLPLLQEYELLTILNENED